MPFVRFHLLVTGKGERDFIGRLLGAVVEGHAAAFMRPEFVGQWTTGQQSRKELKVTGTLKHIPTEFERKVTLQTAQWLRKDPDCFVLLIDDLEHSRAPAAQEVFAYYRSALDKALGEDDDPKRRASVHFLVNMLEAYYFAHPEAVNQVLGTSLTEPTDDVEKIRHPKNDLKNLRVGFDEREHGEEIVVQLDLDKVLDDPETCRSLRTLIAWCTDRLGGEFSTRWRLSDGEFYPITCGQIPSPPSPPCDHAPPRRAG